MSSHNNLNYVIYTKSVRILSRSDCFDKKFSNLIDKIWGIWYNGAVVFFVLTSATYYIT